MIEILNIDNKYRLSLFELIRAYLPEKEFSEDNVVLEKFEDKLRLSFDGKIFEREIISNDFSFQSKKFIFESLKDITKSSTKWGVLTGVRPTKYAYNLYKEFGEEKAFKSLVDQKLITLAGAKDLIEIAKLQDKIISENKNSYSVYVHIPFCPSKCSYCSFITYTNHADFFEPYTDAVVREIESFETVKGSPTSIYIGGGTPTTIGVKNLERIIKSLKNKFYAAKELTVECGRPEELNREMLLMLKNIGVNRISINPQSFNDKTLIAANRNHTVLDIYKSYDLARVTGFDVINMDLIIGLPGEGEEEILHSIDEALRLNPENITTHTLAIKNGSDFIQNKLNVDIDLGKILEEIETLMTVDYEKYYLYRQKRIAHNGENIGYAKDKKYCLYNIMMIEEAQEIYGFGMGATSKIHKDGKLITKANYRDLNLYLKKVNS